MIEGTRAATEREATGSDNAASLVYHHHRRDLALAPPAFNYTTQYVSSHRLIISSFHQPLSTGPCCLLYHAQADTYSCRASRGSSSQAALPLSLIYVAIPDACGSLSCQPWSPRGDLFDQLKTWDRQIGEDSAPSRSTAGAAAAAQAHQKPLVTHTHKHTRTYTHTHTRTHAHVHGAAGALPPVSPGWARYPVFDLVTSPGGLGRGRKRLP
jgi:hypothetical protein